MALTSILPLVVAVILCLPIALSVISERVDRAVTRVAIRAFGGYIDEFRREHPDRQIVLRMAQFPVTYREYGSKTMAYAAIAAIVASILGLYVSWALLLALAVDPETIREAVPGPVEFLANLGGIPALSPWELFTLFLLACSTLGAVTGALTYWLRWWYPSYVADNRSRNIETALPSTIAFIYALSKSGMSFPEVIRIVAQHESTYGEAATEFTVAVRHIDTFGVDIVTALQHMGRHSPSAQFSEFTENLVSVLQSGHSLSAFLERQYHEYQDEAESQQERVLELLATLAEAYVTVFVAGPLFLITILVVIGISVGGTVEPLQALIYLVLPLGNLVFVIYLSTTTNSLLPGGSTPEKPEIQRPAIADDSAIQSDGGLDLPERTRMEANLERLAYQRRIKTLRDRFATPIATLLERPNLTLLITVPIALLAIAWQLPSAIAGFDVGGIEAVFSSDRRIALQWDMHSFDVTAIENVVIGSMLFVLVTFSIFYELHRRRINAIEASIPDLLDRLASVNEAGRSMILAIDHVRDSDLGQLGDELDRVWADVQWGADLTTALKRFEARVRTRAVSRVVTLLTEAMNASGNLSTVLRIASNQAAADRRLKRERGQVMVQYMVVVYVAFLVFLFIIAILALYLLPSVPVGADAPDAQGFGGITEAEMEAYEVLFYHATVVQGLLSGLIAGQLSTGDIRAGAKHAAVLVTLAVIMFAFI